MITNIKTAKAQLSEFLRTAQTEEVIINAHSKPVGVLIGYHQYHSLLDYIEELEDKITVFEFDQNPPDVLIPADQVYLELDINPYRNSPVKQ